MSTITIRQAVTITEGKGAEVVPDARYQPAISTRKTHAVRLVIIAAYGKNRSRQRHCAHI
jgi:hypothetical protein